MHNVWRQLDPDNWADLQIDAWRWLTLDRSDIGGDGSWKHLDFSPPSFAELSAPPVTTGDAALLSQDPAAAFPDAVNSTHDVGLLATLTPGDGSSFITHDRRTSPDLCSVRFMLGPLTLTDGPVTLARGRDESNDMTFDIQFNPTSQQIIVNLPTGAPMIGTITPSLAWHCVELTLVTAAANGLASLHINGCEVQSIAPISPLLRTRYVELGVITKHTDATGTFAIDQAIIAEGYVGPMFTAPLHDHAGDPARWIVIYNNAHTDSPAWTDHYRAARHIPYANLVGLSLPIIEHIDVSQFAELRDAVVRYITHHNLHQAVLGILLGFGVPGTADLTGEGFVRPITALLADVLGHAMPNPLATLDAAVRPTRANTPSFFLTARIDAPDLPSAQALVDRAMDASGSSHADGDTLTIWLSPHATPGPVVNELSTAMTAWSDGVDRMLTHLPMHTTSAAVPPGPVFFDHINHDGFFWGWAHSTPPEDFFTAPAGHRIFAFPMQLAAHTLATLRSSASTHWTDHALSAGYTAIAAATTTPSASEIPSPRLFFEALRCGWTLAEAWFIASPMPGGSLCLIGDPLTTIALPRGGWNIHGPLHHTENLRPDPPSLAVRSAKLATPIPNNLRPAPGASAHYFIRRTDALGRIDTNAHTLRRTVNAEDHATPEHQPFTPIWPDTAHWPITSRHGQLVFHLLWDRPLRHTHVTLIQLHMQPDDGAIETLVTLTPDLRLRHITHTRTPPIHPASFRWFIVGPSGDADTAIVTPWSSRWLRTGAPTAPLQMMDT